MGVQSFQNSNRSRDFYTCSFRHYEFGHLNVNNQHESYDFALGQGTSRMQSPWPALTPRPPFHCHAPLTAVTLQTNTPCHAHCRRACATIADSATPRILCPRACTQVWRHECKIGSVRLPYCACSSLCAVIRQACRHANREHWD